MDKAVAYTLGGIGATAATLTAAKWGYDITKDAQLEARRAQNNTIDEMVTLAKQNIDYDRTPAGGGAATSPSTTSYASSQYSTCQSALTASANPAGGDQEIEQVDGDRAERDITERDGAEEEDRVRRDYERKRHERMKSKMR